MEWSLQEDHAIGLLQRRGLCDLAEVDWQATRRQGPLHKRLLSA